MVSTEDASPDGSPLLEGRLDRLARFLFHLGKGLWKAVPVVGPIVEEVVFEQYRDQLLDQLGTCTSEQLQKLDRLLPIREDVENLEKSIAAWTEEQRIRFGGIAAGLLSSMDDNFLRMEERFDGLEDDVGSIQDSLGEILHKMLSAEQIQQVTERLNERRDQWRQRISYNQRCLLDAIPSVFTPLEQLWVITGELIPECGYKEFKFRLHELEWLDLVERRHGKDGWEYRQFNNEVGAFDG